MALWGKKNPSSEGKRKIKGISPVLNEKIQTALKAKKTKLP